MDKSLIDLQNRNESFIQSQKFTKVRTFENNRVTVLQLTTLENWYFGTMLFPATGEFF